MRHSRRIKSKQKERVRSVIAKELVTSGKFKQKIVKDKRNRDVNLDTFTFRDLVDAINEGEE